jgi:GNAT superfamily N-acetyltransferase
MKTEDKMRIELEYKIPSPEEIETLSQGLTSALPANMTPIDSFGFFLRGEKNVILGGASGFMLFGSIYTHILWVTDSLRGQGHGTDLMRAVEKLGREKNLPLATVNTFSFQALPFYLKLGYQVDFERPGYENGASNYYLSKKLSL